MTIFLDSEQERLQRFSDAKNRLSTWKERIRRIYRYVAPTRWDFNVSSNQPNDRQNFSSGTSKTNQVYDATAILGAAEFANNFQTITFPPFKRWVNLGVNKEVMLKLSTTQQKNVVDELQNITEILFNNIFNSNFNLVINESYLDIFVGTSFIAVNESDGRSPFYFTSIPVNEMVFDLDEKDNISDMWRMWKLPIRKAVALWDLKLTSELESRLKNNPNQNVDFIEGAIIYNKNEPSKKCYYYVQQYEKPVDLFSEWREESPFIGYRYLKSPGEGFGRGPADLIFPWIKTLNKITEFQLRSLKSSAFPIYLVFNQKNLNPHNIILNPGSIISVDDSLGGIPPIQPLASGGNPQLAQISLEQLQGLVREMLFANPLGQVGQTPQMTATESSLRYQDYIRRNGAAVGRISQELIFPLIDKLLRILVKKGIIDKFLTSYPSIPVTLQHKSLSISYNSPLIALQNQEDVVNFKNAMETQIQLAGENAILSLNVEDIPLWLFKKFDAETKLLKSPPEIKDAMQKLAQLTAMQEAPAKVGVPPTPALTEPVERGPQ